MGRSSRTKRQRRAEQEQHDPIGDPCRKCNRPRQEHGTGNCYDSAWEAADTLHRNLRGYPQAQDTIFVCHGTATGQGPIEGRPLHHAWVEYGDIVIDESNGHNWVGRKESYYRLGEIRDVTRYTVAQARAMLTANMHYGPWDANEQAAGSRFVQAPFSSK